MRRFTANKFANIIAGTVIASIALSFFTGCFCAFHSYSK